MSIVSQLRAVLIQKELPINRRATPKVILSRSVLLTLDGSTSPHLRRYKKLNKLIIFCATVGVGRQNTLRIILVHLFLRAKSVYLVFYHTFIDKIKSIGKKNQQLYTKLKTLSKSYSLITI